MTTTSPWRRRAASALPSLPPLVALSGFAWAQPVLDVLGRNAELVAFRGAGRADLWVLGLAVVLVVPVLAWLLELGVAVVVPAARPAVHRVLVALFGAALGAQLGARAFGAGGAGVVVVAVAVAAIVVAVEHRRLVRMWLTYAAWAPLAFLVLFAAFSPAAEAVGGKGTVAGGVDVDDPARTVVLVLDELPLSSLLTADGQIDGDLYPGFAELAATSNWYREASAVSNATSHAVPALLTGRFPRPDAAPVVADHPENLFTLLGGSYEMEVTESLTRLCPEAVCGEGGLVRTGAVGTLLGDGIRLWQEQVGLRTSTDPLAAFEEPAGDAHGDGWDDVGLQQPDRFSSLLASFADTPDRTLHYAHLVLPHTPSQYLPSGRTYPTPAADLGPFWEEPGRFFDLWGDDQGAVDVSRQRAILQTQYADRLVSTMVAELRRLDEWRDALVVVAADHGRAFQPGLPARALAGATDPTPVLPEVMGVPLFVKLPGEDAGAVRDGNVQTVDVLPTIADALGIGLPWEVDGTSALADGPRPRVKTLHQHVIDADLRERPGDVFELPAEGFAAAVVARGVHRFVAADGALRVHRVGSAAALVGRDLTSFDVRPAPSSARAWVHDVAAFDRVDPSSGSVPAFVVGGLEGSGDAEAVVAVDGRVAGRSSTFDWAGRTGVFSLVVPEELLGEGRNELEVYLRRPGSDRLLGPLRLDGSP